MRRPRRLIIHTSLVCAISKPAALDLNHLNWRLWIMPKDNRVFVSNALGQPVLEAIMGTGNGDFAAKVKRRDVPVIILVDSSG